MLRKMADFDIKHCLNAVLSKVDAAAARRSEDLQYFKPVLVAVSKTKPADQVIAAYNEGQRHFGENYVQELLDKGTNTDLLDKCKEIKWHFIGHLQRNKINKVLAVPNLHLVETVDSEKIATALDNAWPKFGPAQSKLRVMIQVNTSGEEVKNGVEPPEVVQMAQHVMEKCKNLSLEGLMTIGKYGYNPLDGPNPDFLCLIKCKETLCKDLNLDPKTVQLSMGMSTDYEQAVEMGSSMVRVGTAIFGSRTIKE